MAFDLVTTALTVGVPVALVLGGLRFLVSLGRDCRRMFWGYE